MMKDELVSNYAEAVDNLLRCLERILAVDYDSLTEERKAKYNIFCFYSMYTMTYMYLRAVGSNAENTALKSKQETIKDWMTKLQTTIDKKSMPRIDQGAVKRHVRSALWEPKEKDGDCKRLKI